MKISRLSPNEVIERVGGRLDQSADPEFVERLEEIRTAVRERGDAAVVELTNSLDAIDQGLETIRVDPAEAEAATEGIDNELKAALELAARNIRLVAEAGAPVTATEVRLPEGQRVEVDRAALGAAGIYAPGGRASYPSSVLMGIVPAKVAGVGRVVLATPPGPSGQVDPVTLAAAHLAGADEIYAVGGAQAIFALAYGTESVGPVDVIVGPGNRWVQEAKRRVFGTVALDSVAGPSDLTVVFGPEADCDLVALDLAAQAEHGNESLVVALGINGADLEEVARAVEALGAEYESVSDCDLWLVQADGSDEVMDILEAIAPEHLELLGANAEALAGEVRNAGCIFIGQASATAFGDYVAGSNHILPTDGSGRSFGPVSVSTFQKSTSRVTFSQESVDLLADPAAVIADSEGFPVHGLSTLRRKSR